MARRSRAEMIEQTRAKLIAAARAAFAEKGYAETSMDDLTAAVGLTRGALYHHFGGKDGLLEAVLLDIDREVTAHLDAVSIGAGDDFAEFRACCSAYLDMALDAEFQRIVLRDAPAVLGERWRVIDRASALVPMTRTLDRLIEAGRMPALEAEALARLLNGALLDAAQWIASVPDPAAARRAAGAAFEALLAGLDQLPRAP